jgi:hypothetical protein
MLVEEMVHMIPFVDFLDHALEKFQDIHYKDFQEIILQILFN